MNNRREPTLAFILEEVRQLREDLKARNRAQAGRSFSGDG